MNGFISGVFELSNHGAVQDTVHTRMFMHRIHSQSPAVQYAYSILHSTHYSTTQYLHDDDTAQQVPRRHSYGEGQLVVELLQATGVPETLYGMYPAPHGSEEKIRSLLQLCHGIWKVSHAVDSVDQH